MVLVIIGLVSVAALPSIKGMKQSNTLAAANRQLLDDLARARAWAIKDRSTIYVVFMPPADPNITTLYKLGGGVVTGPQRTNLLTYQQTSYAMFARRSVGDQPGRENPRYLNSWQTLPDGLFIPAWKFNSLQVLALPGGETAVITPFPTLPGLPLPALNGATNIPAPYIAFDPEGRIVTNATSGVFPVDRPVYLPLARGSLFFPSDPNTGLTWEPADALERPPGNSTNNYNVVRLDPLTGRATVLRPELQ